MTEPLILGVDPGLLVTGWALARGRDFVDHGSLRLRKTANCDRVFEMAALLHDLLVQMRTMLKPAVGAVERYVYQGGARSRNPAGYEVAELAREQAHELNLAGLQVLLIPRNDALRAVVPGRKRGARIPSKKEANAMLVQLYGVRLPNQHERDALMQCWAARQRWRAGR